FPAAAYHAGLGAQRGQRVQEEFLEYTYRAQLFGAGVTLTWQPPAELLRQETVKTAQRADVVVAFVGLWPGLEGEEMGIPRGRLQRRLPHGQRLAARAAGSSGC